MYAVVYIFVLLCANGLSKLIIKPDAEEGPLILTPFIEKGEVDKARALSAVDESLFAGVKSHAGYFTVNKENKWNLFFWYFPAQGVPLESTPLLVWLQGGPGGSSLYGLFTEIGPIQMGDSGKVEKMPITWGSSYSLLFIDNPVGTGFSFSEDPDKLATNQDMVGASLLSLIQQFLQVYPELRSAPLFLTGESYAGKYIPAFGHYIHHNKNDSMPINLKGLAIGDGFTDPRTLMHYSTFALQIGVIDHKQAKVIEEFEKDAVKAIDEHDWKSARLAVGLIDGMLQSNIANLYNYAVDKQINENFLVSFLNEPKIQSALHVKKMVYSTISQKVFDHMADDMLDTVKPWLEELLEHYGVMCYNGQFDVLVGYALSVNTYRSLNWSGQEAYLKAKRGVLLDENSNRINSFVKESGNFLDVMVRNAGHMVPADQPQAAKQIIDMFIEKFK